jgi:hypothetical protein
LVVCNDVLEHVEPERLAAVLQHLRDLTWRGGYFTVATRESNKWLSDGRNAHLIIESVAWWRAQMIGVGFEMAGCVASVEKHDPAVTRGAVYWVR